LIIDNYLIKGGLIKNLFIFSLLAVSIVLCGFSISHGESVTENLNFSGNLVDFSTSQTSYQFKNPVFNITFQNTGDKNITPKGYLRIKNFFNNTIAIININKSGLAIPPGETYEFREVWPDLNPFGIGNYKAYLVLYYGGEGAYTSETSFTVFPWKLALLEIILIFTIYYLVKFFTYK